jgi:pimeloyl-ACP methyl ester carboxylesterase
MSVFVTVQDGLRLHARCWGPRTAPLLPAVCLPGLARSGADFEELAAALAGPAPHASSPAASGSGMSARAAPGDGRVAAARRVIALDSRGRGKSDYDRDPTNYNLQVELADLLAVLTALAIPRAVFVGTSRGGILAMLLSAVRPAAIAGCVLNDIGPVIETKGLMRIKSYVGKLPQPASMQDGAEILRRLFASQFPKLGTDEWVAFARRTYKQAGSRIVADYDPRLGASLEGIDPEQPPAPLWKEFDGLGRVPVMVIRGGNSDILAAETVEAMRARRSRLEVIEVPDQGHAPILSGSRIIGAIADFVSDIR